jgi:hypothetical protein
MFPFSDNKEILQDIFENTKSTSSKEDLLTFFRLKALLKTAKKYQ